MAISFGVELDCNYPHVEIVDSLLDEVIAAARIRNNTVSAPMLDDSKLVHKFVKAARMCKRSCHVDRLEWDTIEERVFSYLRSIQPRIEMYHDDDFSIDTFYREWDKLEAPSCNSDTEDSGGGSNQWGRFHR